MGGGDHPFRKGELDAHGPQDLWMAKRGGPGEGKKNPEEA
jgi:hypothetical protein